MSESLALAGVRILDLTRLLPGPYCTHLLADLGAEVIKIEEPFKGDGSRQLEEYPGVSSYFLQLNRNKKSLAINLKSDHCRSIFLDLVRRSDVIVEGFRPGVAARLSIDYEAVKEVNSAIVYCSISGYGQDGPRRNCVGHDINYLSYAGVLGITGLRGGGPVIPGIQLADIGGGALMAVAGILVALMERKNSGQGQFIDISMMDGIVSWLSLHGAKYLLTGELSEPGTGMLNGAFPCYNLYQLKDGSYISLGALEEHFWAKVCIIIDHPEYIPYQFDQGIIREEIFQTLRNYFKEKTREEAEALFGSDDTCFGVVKSLAEVFEDTQVKSRNMVIQTEIPGYGALRQIGFPIKLSRTPARVRTAAPLLGEHTEEILLSMGYGKEWIDSLKEKQLIQTAESGAAGVASQTANS